MSLSSFNQFKASLLNKSINFFFLFLFYFLWDIMLFINFFVINIFLFLKVLISIIS